MEQIADKLTRMKHFGLQGIVLLVLTFLLNACASRNGGLADESSPQSATVVPGENVSSEGMVPGAAPGRAGANMRW